MTEIPNQIENNGELKIHMNLFLQQISFLESIRNSLKFLASNGHFDFQDNYMEEIPSNESISTFETKNKLLIVTKVNEKLEQWLKKIVKKNRKMLTELAKYD